MTPEDIYDARWAWANTHLKEVAQHYDETFDVWKRLHALKATRMIEIGSYAGGSLYLYAGALRPGAEIVVVDLPIEGDNASEILSDTIRKLEAEGYSITRFDGDSADPAIIKAVRAKMPVADFAHIDGDHTYPAVLSDWTNYGTLVRPGGLIALHDIAYLRKAGLPPARSGQVFQELLAAGYEGEAFIQTENIVSKSGKVSGIGLVRMK